MPQASEELRALMDRWFGDPVSDEGPTRFLLARGWTEQGGMWDKPTRSHNVSSYEEACLIFLRDEWDHDWIRPLHQNYQHHLPEHQNDF